ncbi:hypothetical protein [Pseudofulvibacter geojedonensis]|uniref:Lysylphosphatidylglycerol synthase-like protein n=1 Tax=Pseudofulvibacter geojedonensis TaxID=1123758 RepID=A0ABW3I011_9FLAO
MSVNNKAPFSVVTYKRILFVLIKLSIVLGASYFVYNKLTHNETLDFNFLLNSLHEHNIITIKNMVLLILLSVINWGLECFKWKVLVSNFTPISFTEAIEQSLGALTASIMTPNRIGEYGAKAIYFKKPFRKKVLGLTLIGNLSQLLITIMLGSIGLAYFVYQFQQEVDYDKIAAFVIISITIIYLLFSFQPHKKISIKGYSFQRLKNFTKKLHQKTIVFSILLALFRYLVFAHQFYFLLILFRIEASYITAMALITSMYIISSALPTIFIFDAVIKGSIAVWLFSFINANELTIVVITTLMWLLNFALPSVFGSYFVLNFKMNFSDPAT